MQVARGVRVEAPIDGLPGLGVAWRAACHTVGQTVAEPAARGSPDAERTTGGSIEAEEAAGRQARAWALAR